MVPCSGPGVAALILYALLEFSSSTTQAYAALTNVTIDDTNSTFWAWAGAWNAITPATPCIRGLVARRRRNLRLVHIPRSAQGLVRRIPRAVHPYSSAARGSAIYIYGIDDPAAPNITFGMNNPPLMSFHYYGGTDYLYNSLFFAATDLDASAPHTVTWILKSLGDLGGAGLFDYAVVTVNIRQKQKPSPRQNPPRWPHRARPRNRRRPGWRRSRTGAARSPPTLPAPAAKVCIKTKGH
ncbi:hypothetical protein K438DRAFT_1775542 [Mycena galopus ATCC 62051]|nr:hypothetical protein K438DRAFT_1775542 [Mycena galopus ATCC 62051]